MTNYDMLGIDEEFQEQETEFQRKCKELNNIRKQIEPKTHDDWYETDLEDEIYSNMHRVYYKGYDNLALYDRKLVLIKVLSDRVIIRIKGENSTLVQQYETHGADIEEFLNYAIDTAKQILKENIVERK